MDNKDAKNKFPGLKRFERLHLVENVTEELRNKILNNSLKPGSNLPSEGELTELLSVSRTVVREAMRNLQAQGLIEVSQGKRARVKNPDCKTAVDTLQVLLKRGQGSENDLNEVRIIFEGEIAALAAKRATPDIIASLEEVLINLKKAKNVKEAVEYDTAFHKMLARAAGNPIFELLVETLSGLLKESQRKSYKKTGFKAGIKVSCEAHSKILDAVKNHNSRAARQMMIDQFPK